MKEDFNTKQTKRENEPQVMFHLLSEALETGFEWLLISENGTQTAFKQSEIEVVYKNGKVFLEWLSGESPDTRQVLAVQHEDRRLLLELTGSKGPERETVELFPRITAADLMNSIKAARMEMAGRIAQIAANELSKGSGCTIANVRLSQGIRAGEYGSNAQIILQISRFQKPGEQLAVFAPVTAKISNLESFLVSALSWYNSVRERAKKNRIEKLWIVVHKKNLAKMKKILALLKPVWTKQISLFQLDPDNAEIHETKIPGLKDLWREKPRKIKVPGEKTANDAAGISRDIAALDPSAIDITFSAHGENLRFFGLPFLRTRALLGKEKAWFGFNRGFGGNPGGDRRRQILDETTRDDLLDLVAELKEMRSAGTPNKDHHFYRASPEHWLEAVLSRDITQLDANLILSPIYQQFRVSAEQVDLLALRRDGRLVIIELKVAPNREMIFQAANYWRLIELQRRSGNLARARAFGDLEILDEPALVYLAAPALSFHRDLEFWASTISPKLEIYRYDLHENWREKIDVLHVDKLG